MNIDCFSIKMFQLALTRVIMTSFLKT